MLRETKRLRDEETKWSDATVSLRLSVSPSLSRSGFSFAEVMFAVMILGIGFIMIAAIFPVAIKQTKTTSDETIVGSLARTGVANIERVAIDAYMPATGTATQPLMKGAALPMLSTSPMPNIPMVGLPTCWQAIRGNVILPEDPRFAWVAFFKRDGNFADRQTWSSYAQITIIGVQISGQRDVFNVEDVKPAAAASWPNLYPRRATVTVTNDTTGNPDTIAFAPLGTPDFTAAIAEGTYVIVGSNDNLPLDDKGRLNGRVFRVGIPVGANTWELIPGNDYEPDPDPDGTGPQSALPNTFTADAWFVGKSFYDPNNNGQGTPAYDGNAMDITAYTTFVQVKQ